MRTRAAIPLRTVSVATRTPVAVASTIALRTIAVTPRATIAVGTIALRTITLRTRATIAVRTVALGTITLRTRATIAIAATVALRTVALGARPTIAISATVTLRARTAIAITAAVALTISRRAIAVTARAFVDAAFWSRALAFLAVGPVLALTARRRIRAGLLTHVAGAEGALRLGRRRRSRRLRRGGAGRSGGGRSRRWRRRGGGRRSSPSGGFGFAATRVFLGPTTRLLGATAFVGLARSLQRPLTGGQFALREIEIGRCAGRRRRGRRTGGLGFTSGLRGRGGARTRLHWRALAFAAALGLHHYGLGSAVAEALTHRPGVHRALARLQGQGRTSARLALPAVAISTLVVLVPVAHSLALLNRKARSSPAVA